MTNITRKKRRFSKWQWLIMTVAILLVAGMTILVLEKTHVIDLFHASDSQQNDQPNSPNTVNYAPATDEDTAVSDSVNQSGADSGSQSSTQKLQVTLTMVTQDEATRELVVRALIEGALSGSCKLELIKDGSTMLTKTSNVTQQNNYVTCEGFNVSPAEFPSLGEFTVKLTVISGSSSATSTYIITLEK